MGARKAAVADTVPGEATADGIPPELADALTRKANAEADIAVAKATVEQYNLDNIESSNDLNRVLYISGPILDTEADVATLMRWSRRDPAKPITIYINTPGGSVFDGNALVSCIRELQRAGHRVTIHGVGMVMSFGSVLMQVADDRVLDKDVVFMLHSINAPIITGQLEQITDTTKMLEAVQDRILDELASKATISKAKLKQLTRRKDLYLSAAEALKYGLCDRVV